MNWVDVFPMAVVERSGDVQRTELTNVSATLPWHGASQIQKDIQLATKVQQSGRPNAFGLQILIESNWNFSLLQTLVTSTTDREVVMFLKYGWPLNRELDVPLSCTFQNHGGATDHPRAIEAYLAKEIR